MNPSTPAPAAASSGSVLYAQPRSVAGWLNFLYSALVRGSDPLAALHQARELALAPATQALAVWIHPCPDATWAAQLDQLRSRLAGVAEAAELLRRYPLLGVPFAVKDNIDVAGAPTSAACPSYTRVAEHSATVVQRLLDAGALWLGKTNLDQFATGLVGTRSPYGQPACVSDAGRISGGSSSGSAVVVARAVVPFALGTDTAGSGRVPAGFNGLVGLKPTPGRASTAGVLPACRTLDCVSVFAHDVADAAHVLAVMEGPDAADPYSAWAPGPAALPAHRPLRVGVPARPDLDPALGYPVAWAAAVERLRALPARAGERAGVELVEIDMAPLHEVAALLYDGPWVAERHATVRELLRREPEAFDPVVRQVIARAIGQTATATFEAQYRLRALQARLAALWHDIDLLMVPTAPTHPSFEQVAADPLGANSRLGRYTNFVNLLGWCALALPAGQALTAQATLLPFGVTFIAPGQHDAALARFGLRWQAAGDAHLSAASPPAPRPPAAAPPWLRQPAHAPELLLAVVGAHLSGLPLNGQLIERGARLVEATHTAPLYRLYALPGTTPPKPGLVRVAAGEEGGAAIALEVWAMPQAQLGSFLALIPAPLGLGSLTLADGRQVHGFLCEAHAVSGARDISALGGWRAYLATLAAGMAPASAASAAADAAGTAAGVDPALAAYVDAAAARIGLPLQPEHRPGVVLYVDLAAGMAELVMGCPLGPHDDPAESFVPISPDMISPDIA
ncbi:MAG: allophanate hydrolase [Pseudomonadota bacterium]